MPRESITLEPEVLATSSTSIRKSFGLDATLSVAKRNRRDLRGLLSATHARSIGELIESNIYAALAADPESRAVAVASHAMAFEDGLV